MTDNCDEMAPRHKRSPSHAAAHPRRRRRTAQETRAVGPSPRSPSKRTAAAHGAEAQATAGDDLRPVVAANLRRLRNDRGLSLERLAQRSGVSRAMLGQIELVQSTPTINVLWKIARALEVPFSALITGTPRRGPVLLPARDARRIASRDGRFSTRALFPTDTPRRVEFYELRLAARARQDADAHPPETLESLVVSAGRVEVTVHGRAFPLGPGDALEFQADEPHRYRNLGTDEAVLYLVMTYADGVA